MGAEPKISRDLERGELVRLLYRLGHQHASGVLTLASRHARAEVLVLRRGGVVVGDGELAKRTLGARLARLVAVDRTAPPFGGAAGRAQVPAVDRTAPPFGGAAGRAQVPAVDRTAPPFGGAAGRAQVPAVDRTAPPFGGAAGRAQVPAVDRTAPPFGGAAGRAQVPAGDALHAVFEGGSSYPPGAQHVVPLVPWVRGYLEAQLDNSLAERIVRELAGMRLSVRADQAPVAADDADRRMLAAMRQPRRLDQIWPLARTPRFRLLAFLWFLRAIDALEVEGIVAEQSAPNRVRASDPRREAAARLLGIDEHADGEAVKRAYRRIARSLHPDLQPDADAVRRRALERRFAEVTAAYELLG